MGYICNSRHRNTVVSLPEWDGSLPAAIKGLLLVCPDCAENLVREHQATVEYVGPANRAKRQFKVMVAAKALRVSQT